MDRGALATQVANLLWPLACFYLGCWNGKAKPGGWRLLAGVAFALACVLAIAVAVELVAAVFGFAP